MPDCQICQKPITNKSHRPGAVQKYCSIECRHQGARIMRTHICKVCKKPFEKRRKGKVICSTECLNENKKRPIKKKVLINAMLRNRFGKWPCWSAIGRKLKRCHRFLVKMAKFYGLIDIKRQGPIVNGVYLPIPEKKKKVKIKPKLTSKRTLKKILLENRHIDEKGCWLWKKRVDIRGYGVMYLPPPYDNEFLVKFIALYVFQDIPLEEKKFALHKCNVRHCFNPEHMVICKTRKELGAQLTKYGKNKLPIGVKHVKWVLDLPTALDIRDAIKQGETNRQIVKRLGIKSQIVQNIRKRRTYKYIWKLKHEYLEAK